MRTNYPNNRHLAELIVEANQMISALFYRHVSQAERERLSEDWDDPDDVLDAYSFEEPDEVGFLEDEIKSDRMFLLEIKMMITNLHEDRFGSAPNIPTWDSVREQLEIQSVLASIRSGWADLAVDEDALTLEEQREREADNRLSERYSQSVDVHIGKLPNEYELLSEIADRLTEQEEELGRIGELIDSMAERSDRRWWR